MGWRGIAEVLHLKEPGLALYNGERLGPVGGWIMAEVLVRLARRTRPRTGTSTRPETRATLRTCHLHSSTCPAERVSPVPSERYGVEYLGLPLLEGRRSQSAELDASSAEG